MIELQSLGQYRIETAIDSFWAAPRLRVSRYRAVDTVRKRPVLLSLLDNEAPSSEVSASEAGAGLDKHALLRLLDHSLPAGELVHPHISWVWEAGASEGYHYIAERAVQGQSLAQHLAEHGPLSWAESQKAVEQIARGLDYAHERGWNHGALSPAMVWLSTDLGAITSGWGLQRGLQALRLESAVGEGRPAAAPYLAPERLANGAPSPAGDLYGLACLWFEMLTGQVLFPANPPEGLEAQRQAGPIFPGAWPEGTPWEIETALERATAAAPTSRYASSAELAAAPVRLAAEMPISAEERARRAALARQRQESAEQTRRQAEETSRQAALNQARREIEEQVQRASQASLRLNGGTGETVDEPNGEAVGAPTNQAVDAPTDQAVDAPPGAADTASAATASITEAREAQPDTTIAAPGSPNFPADKDSGSASAAGLPAASAPVVSGFLEAGSPGHRGVSRKAGAGSPANKPGGPASAAGISSQAVRPAETAGPGSTAAAPTDAFAHAAAPAGLEEPTRTDWLSGSAGAAEVVKAPARRSDRAPRWIVWAGLAVAVLLFGGLWWSSQGAGGGLVTATPSAPAASATLPEATQAGAPAGQVSPSPLAVTTAVPTATDLPATATATATRTPTATRPASATPSLTRTPTITATPSLTATRPRLPTRTPRPENSRNDRDADNP